MKTMSLLLSMVFSLSAFGGDYIVTNDGKYTIPQIQVTANQMILKSAEGFYPSVIFWRQDTPTTKKLYFCEDRDQRTTCKLLGKRGYTDAELKLASKQLVEKTNSLRKSALITFAMVGGAIALGIFSGGTLMVPAIIMGVTSFVGMTLIIERADQTQAAAYYLDPKNGIADSQDFDRVAQFMSDALSSLPNQAQASSQTASSTSARLP
jgi:hypothetical protein